MLVITSQVKTQQMIQSMYVIEAFFKVVMYKKPQKNE